MKIIEGSLLVAISSAAVLVFLALGFRPAPAKKSRQRLQLQSVRLAAMLLVLVALLLGTTTARLVKETAVIQQHSPPGTDWPGGNDGGRNRGRAD
jgi:multisubunit Na+/H+ antiporter MnhB subunit